MSRIRYHAIAIEQGRLLVQAAPGVDAKELKNYGARWVKPRKLWAVPARWQDLELMEADGIRVELPELVAEELTKFRALDDYLQTAETFKRSPNHDRWTTLMDHQRVAVAFLASRDRCLLALTPGLGKTACAVVAADVRNFKRILVVAPLTLHRTWETEISTWSSEASSSRNPADAARWTITNPEQIVARKNGGAENGTLREPYASTAYDLVVFDESILYKNRSAKRSQAMVDLANRDASTNVWMLSGSPVAAYADDLYSQMRILRPNIFTSYWRFASQWCQLETSPWGTKVVGNRAPERLTSYLRDLMLSRTPEHVKKLPEALFETVHVALNDHQLEALDRLRELNQVEVNGEVEICDNVLAQLTRAAQIVSCPKQLDPRQDHGPKVDALVGMTEWIPLPAIVWTQYRETAQAVAEALRGKKLSAEVLDGSTTKAQREQLIERFQGGDLQVLVIQLQTGKFGLSLTKARSAVFVDRSYSSDDWIQAIARVRRLSSTESVPNYVLHAGSVDRLVDDILSRKLHSIQDLSLSDLARYL